MTWTIDGVKGYESDKIKYLAVPYTRGVGLDLGCGPKLAFPHFIGVDNGSDFGRGAASFVVDTCESMPMFADDSLDFVFSSHLLEHINDTKAALTEWWRVVKVGGHLVLYLPHKDFYPNIGQVGSNPEHVHDFLPGDIVSLMSEIAPGYDIMESEDRNEGNEYSFYQVYRKRDDAQQIDLSDRTARGKTFCICRFGGFGDMLQMSSILPRLKEQGYHVTVMTTPRGRDVIEHDPSIDAWIVQDTDQVPNGELTAYWAAWESRFDKFVNLSESVEATAIAYPGRPPYFWGKEAKAYVYGNVNYLRLQHAVAGVKYKPAVKFYETDMESAFASAVREQFADRPVVLWSLAGSSFHKAYPWTDAVISRLLLETNCAVILCGDIACKILEAGWEKEPRVLLTSGEIGIRFALALANHADVVVGPETGILNSVSYDQKIAKVIMLSHSSRENLCDDWKNTVALTPYRLQCPCYPCHMMHLVRDTCTVDEESGAALCAASITPDRVFDAINRTLKKYRKAA